MPTVACVICSHAFYAKPSHILKGWGKYCSKQCQYTGFRTGLTVGCQTCGLTIYRSLKAQTRSQSQSFFCSKSCQTKWRNSQIFIGQNHGNWTTGESSYRQRLLRSDRPKICQKCHTDDVRILAVHHKDKDRSHNTLSNLIWLCHNCHYLVHNFPDESHGFLTESAG